MDKPISSNRLDKYLNEEFYHYLNLYKNIKNYGLPYDSWLEAPHWLLDLVDTFDDIKAEHDRHKKVKGLI